MRIKEKRIKFMKRYVLDVGDLKNFKKYSSNRLNMISNKIYILKNEIFQQQRKNTGNWKITRLKKILNIAYRLGRKVFERKIKKKKINLKKYNRLFYQRLTIYRIFRKYYLNIKVKQFQKKLKEVKGNEIDFMRKLETRLDIILLRSGLFKTIYEVRQYINHRQIIVDGKIANKPGYEIKVGQIIGIKAGAKREKKRRELLKTYIRYRREQKRKKRAKKVGIIYYPKFKQFKTKTPTYLETDRVLMLTTLIREPKLSDIKYPFTVDNIKKLKFVNILKTQKKLR